MVDLFAERIDYRAGHLVESAAPADPYELFTAWLADALGAKSKGLLPEPTAMVLATVEGARPSARTVLLKEVDARGFVFFTNYESRKSREMAAVPEVALLFPWYSLQRQVRVEGTAARVSRQESEAYFATRPRGSQVGAWASRQSTRVPSAEALAEAYRRAEQHFAGKEVPCPPYWGGYRVTPRSLEFWQGQPSRMHDRLLYTQEGGGWALCRLAP